MTTIEQRAQQAGSDLRQVAEERAEAMGDAEHVVAAARRRVRRQGAVAAVGLVAVVAFIGVLLPRASVVIDPVAPPATVWTGATVELPEDWDVAAETLMPNGPREQFVASTAELVPGGDQCAQAPENAMEQLGPTDGLVMVQRLHPAQPDDPTLGRLQQWPDTARNQTTLRECPVNGDQLDVYWFHTQLDGDGYWVLAAFGEDAGDQRRAQGLSILNSFRPGSPDGSPELSALEGPQQADDIIPQTLREQIGLQGRWAATSRLARHTPGYTYYVYRNQPSQPAASPDICLLILPDDGPRWSAGCAGNSVTTRGPIVEVSNGDVVAGLVHDGITNTAELPDADGSFKGIAEAALPVVDNVYVLDE